jgi:hypothetical protein
MVAGRGTDLEHAGLLCGEGLHGRCEHRSQIVSIRPRALPVSEEKNQMGFQKGEFGSISSPSRKPAANQGNRQTRR